MIASRNKNSLRAQSTVEFALLTPIVFFLIYLIFQGYKLNTKSSQEAMNQHQDKLEKLDHGNGSFELDGIDIPDNSSNADLIPLTPSTSLTNQILQQGGQILAQIGLNVAISNVDFLNGDSYFSGAAKGAVQSAGSSYINSGFKTVDWDGVAWGAAAGALSSQEATEDFQGKDFLGSSTKEALGSAAQNAAISYAKSQGDWKAAASGAVSGLLGSDTMKGLENSKNDIFYGAAKGAVQSTVTGALNGKVDLKTVAIATGMGAFQTKSVASKIPFTKGMSDPRQSASFQAVNAGLSTAISGGSAKQTLYAAASGAFYSQQSMNTITNGNVIKASLAGSAYGAAVGLAQGQSLQAVGTSALQGMATGLAVRETNRVEMMMKERYESLNGKNEVIDNYDNPAFQTKVSDNLAQEIAQDQSMQSIEVGVIDTWAANPAVWQSPTVPTSVPGQHNP